MMSWVLCFEISVLWQCCSVSYISDTTTLRQISCAYIGPETET
jgi:hypothetical protein